METTLETLRLVIGDDSEDLVGVETTLETKQLGNGDNCRDLPAGDLRGKWRLSSWGLMMTTLKT